MIFWMVISNITFEKLSTEFLKLKKKLRYVIKYTFKKFRLSIQNLCLETTDAKVKWYLGSVLKTLEQTIASRKNAARIERFGSKYLVLV